MLCATVLLSLVASAVLTNSLAFPVPAGPTDNTIDGIHDNSINGTLSGVSSLPPICSADYSRMSVTNRKMQQNVPKPYSICVRSDGYFVATFQETNFPHLYMYDACGWFVRRIDILQGTPASKGFGCAFTANYLFFSLSPRNQILQFRNDGQYVKVFASGAQFFRMATNGYLLYTSIFGTNQIRAYDTRFGNLVYVFQLPVNLPVDWLLIDLVTFMLLLTVMLWNFSRYKDN